MVEKLLYSIGAIFVVILAPCLLTYIISGRKVDAGSTLAKQKTGKDVLLQTEEGNVLLDVEVYLAGVMPGEVDASVSSKYMEAQAVALRTQVYATMGENTFINADELPFAYYTEKDYIEKWGKAKYMEVKERYDKAVLKTCGKVMNAQ